MATLRETALAASEIIFGNEGGYGSVNRDDCGALSVGKLQWHGVRALALLRVIAKEIPDTAETMLGRMYGEITSDADWSGRTVTAEEAGRIASLLLTEEGKRVQDETALNDVEADLYRGVGYGLRNCGALIYFADGANQYGRYSALWQKAAEAAVQTGGTLTDLHRELCGRTTGHLERRKKVYEAVMALPICAETLDNGGETSKETENENNKSKGKENEKRMVTHLVVRGDTLSAIAKANGCTVDEILDANRSTYPTMTRNYIVCGWTLTIPAAAGSASVPDGNGKTDGKTDTSEKGGTSEAEMRALLRELGILREGETLTGEADLVLALGRLCLLLGFS